MPQLTLAPSGEDALDLLASFNERLLADNGMGVKLSRHEIETRLRSYLGDGYQARLFARGEQPIGYVLYRVNPKYAYIRHFFLDRATRREVTVEDAFSLLRQQELRDYASIRLDVPESNRELLALWESVGFRPRSVRLELHTARKKKIRKSCGAIVYRRRWGSLEYLVVQHVNGGHWGFPKGHVEPGESEMETAAREVHEEVGLSVAFRNGFYERIFYLTPKERRKEVVLFLSRVRHPRVRLQGREIGRFRWLPYWETRDLLTFENTRLVLDKAQAYLQERGA